MKREDVALGQHVQAQRRLVQEEDLRLVEQRHAQVGAHPLAEAQLARQAVEELVQPEQLLDHAEHPLVALARDVPDDALPLEARRHRLVPPQLGALAEDDADAADVARAVAHRVHPQRRAPSRRRAPAGRRAA